MIPNSEQAWRRASLKENEQYRERRAAGYAAGTAACQDEIEKFKLMTARERRRELKKAIKVIDDHESGTAQSRKALTRLYVVEESFDQITAFAEKPLVMERPQNSVYHNLRSDAIQDRLINLNDVKWRERGAIWDSELLKDAHVFLIQHDWSAAFKNAGDFEGGPFQLPFDICAFEFRFSGAPVFAICVVVDEVIFLLPVIGIENGWLFGEHYRYLESGEWNAAGDSSKEMRNLAQLLGKQVKAISVTLDAEISETEVIRAPHKLNAARVKRGDIPLHSYHIVSLARRHRAAPLVSTDDHALTRKRLHFRRGHWRHFETWKTWVKWCLVGDPDLGFVDKHYKL